jgi:hypothetical protein
MFDDEFVPCRYWTARFFVRFWIFGGARGDAPRSLLLVFATTQAGSVPERRKG